MPANAHVILATPANFPAEACFVARYRTEIKFGLITAALLGGLLALDRTSVFAGLDSVNGDFIDTMAGLGVAGVFFVAFVANSSLLIQVPYTLPLLSLALGGASITGMMPMAAASGIGAGLGEVVSYVLAERLLGGNESLSKSGLFRWVKTTVASHPRLAPVLVFAWAASFLPDDTVIMPLGMTRYGMRRIFLPLFSGKIVHSVGVALVFYYFTGWSAERISRGVQADLAVGLLVLFVLAVLYQVEKNMTRRPGPGRRPETRAPSLTQGPDAVGEAIEA